MYAGKEISNISRGARAWFSETRASFKRAVKRAARERARAPIFERASWPYYMGIFLPPPLKPPFCENRPFNVFNGHDIFS